MLRLFVTATSVVLLAAACSSATAETVEQTAPVSSAPVVTTTTASPTTTTTVQEPVDEPDTISTLSRLGRMTWELHDLDFMVTHVGSYDDGYAALLYDSLAHRPEYRGLAEPAVVAISSDGVVWTPLPTQPGGSEPFTAQMLAVDGERLLVLGRPYSESGAPRTDEVLAFVWERGAWNEFSVSVPIGSLTRGGELNAGYFADGTPVFLSRRGGAWYQSDTGFDYLPAATERWPNFLLRFDTVEVWLSDSGVVMPTSTIAAVIEHDGRFVAAGTPGSGGQAWTSTDGRHWTPIDRIAAAWDATQDDIVVSPEIIDAGGIGWVAVGAWTGTGAIWVSSDGISWGLLEEVPGPAGWDVRVPWPPATVVDDERILIYGRAYDAVLPSSASMVWVGTVDE